MHGENELLTLQFFRNVAPETVEKLWNAGTIKQYQKGHILMRARDDTNHVYIQLSGKSMVYNLTHTGKRKIIFVYGEGVLLNEHILQMHSASLFCEIIEKSRIFTVSMAFFLKCMEKDFSLTRAVLEMQERRLWRMGHQLKNTMGCIYMEQRLAAKLWRLSKDFGIQKPEGVEIDLNISVTMLADMLGASREATSRMCSTLINLGMLKIQKKRITVTNAEQLISFYKTGKI